ncbi:DUF1344 domain-containing protein [Aminobacter sp. MET-1]|uniref:DUF1344 domain-containing protein n=1 Tax=Aminobacter sp. MET-1 TaxID=2951085 RepID=UPI00226A76EE|nr:DUF1344 domain-containing protein [Aminobacter sp. MET-1]MCX8570777.1 DUF1344 domain-containing protein [Aminobacter sp. MET-1]
MRKLIISLGTLALLTGASFAATAEGTVREYIPETKVVTLEDGKSYTIPQDVAVPAGLAPGVKVSINLDDDDITKVTSVTLSPG